MVAARFWRLVEARNSIYLIAGVLAAGPQARVLLVALSRYHRVAGLRVLYGCGSEGGLVQTAPWCCTLHTACPACSGTLPRSGEAQRI